MGRQFKFRLMASSSAMTPPPSPIGWTTTHSCMGRGGGEVDVVRCAGGTSACVAAFGADGVGKCGMMFGAPGGGGGGVVGRLMSRLMDRLEEWGDVRERRAV
jgi:hypothetical protein